MKKFVCNFIILTILIGAVVPFGGGFDICNVSAATVLESFEEDTLSQWHTEGGGNIERSDEYAKKGTYSLRWDFEASSRLKLDNHEPFKMLRNSSNDHGIKMWIYNEKPMDGQLIFKIGETSEVSGNPIYEFTYNLDFSGWRALWARVNYVATNTLYTGRTPDAMEIVAPSGVESGTLWLDVFEISETVMYSASPDEQMPYITAEYNSPHAFSKKIPERSLKAEIAPEYIREFDKIEKRIYEYIMPSGINFNTLSDDDPLKIRYDATMSGIKSEIASYDKHGIKRLENGRVTGPGVFAAMDYNHSPKFSSFERAWIALALDYKFNKNEDSKRKILELFDFFNDQGWAAGSACGGINLDEITADGYAWAVFLMRDELKEAGIFEREMETMRWRSEFGIIYEFYDMSPDYSIYVDMMRSVVMYQLLYILAQDDTPEKLRDMLYYTDYFEKVVNARGGFRGGIKPDGTMWHHCGPYISSYGSQGLTTLTHVKYLINGTYFDIDAAATEKLKKAVMVYEESTEGQDMHVGLSGRFPEQNFGSMTNAILQGVGFMALCGDRDLTEVFMKYYNSENERLASFYRSNLNRFVFTHTVGQIYLFQELVDEALKKGYTPRGEMELNKVYPYGSYNVHRRDGWMVTTKGFSQYIWDYECGGTENVFGRYVSYGPTLLYSKEGAKASGIDIENGWDWNRWPGATTKHLPLSELRGTGGNNHRYFSDQTFLGGVSSENNGVFSMKIHDMFSDTSFRFNKTCFAFGDEIICLGSDIYCDDTVNPIETTVFQSNMGEDTTLPFYMSSKEAISEFPYSESVKDNRMVYLTDPYGNSFIIPNTKGLKIERGVQDSIAKNGSKKTSGNYTTVWFDHGTNPEGEKYEYVILPQKSHEDAGKLASNPDYEVLKHDSQAHIVKNSTFNSIGYALFDSELKLENGAFKSSSVPCIVMETAKADGRMLFTYCDPDLRLEKFTFLGNIHTGNEVRQVSQINYAEVVLNGCWTFDGEQPQGITIVGTNSRSNTTTLRFECVDGKQLECMLRRIDNK